MISLSTKKTFIINVIYYTFLIALFYFTVRYAIPYLLPFIIGFLVAFVLKHPINWLSHQLKLNR